MTPGSFHFQRTLTSIIAEQCKWEEALTIAPNFLKDEEMGKTFPNYFVEFFSKAAASGFSKDSSLILKQSPCALFVEPLIVALQMIASEEYNAPQEVAEIAKDIKKEIEDRKQT